MKDMMIKINNLINPLRMIADKVGSPLLDLSFRLYLGWAFFKSGMLRAKDYFNGSWDTQVFLFEMEHPVPGLDASLAAPVTTIAELALPVLVSLGLFSRFGAAGLFVMALVIQLTYQENYQHILWMALAASIFIKGPGPLSVDNLMVKWLKRDSTI